MKRIDMAPTFSSTSDRVAAVTVAVGKMASDGVEVVELAVEDLEDNSCTARRWTSRRGGG